MDTHIDIRELGNSCKHKLHRAHEVIRHGGYVDARDHDDMQVDHDPALLRGDVDALAQAIGGKQAIGALHLVSQRHAHDAIAFKGGEPHEIGNDVVGYLEASGNVLSHTVLLSPG